MSAAGPNIDPAVFEILDRRAKSDVRTFETALKRALARRQENLPVHETIRAYETIYFPAQRIHLRQDRPRETADLIIRNDG